MEKATVTTAEEVKTSVGSIYSALLSKRAKKKEEKEELLRIQKEAKEEEKEEKEEEKKEKLSKKEKLQKDLDKWKDIVSSLTGDDLEYTSKKSKKKKYHKWIDDEMDNTINPEKKKKIKKKNYKKEFEPELNMLKALLAEQNRFNTDLQKRFQTVAGPAGSKDAMFPNKTLVELASTIMNGRNNSLSMVKEIGSLKKNMADLYMKQKKLDFDLMGANNVDSADIGLIGSSLASSMFRSDSYTPNSNVSTPMVDMDTAVYSTSSSVSQTAPVDNVIQATPFDPETWGGIDGVDSSVMYENVPHEIYVEKSNSTGAMRFVAKRTDTNEEIKINSMPTVDPSTLDVDEKKMTVKGKFEDIYPLRMVD